ncbi:NADP-dependent oxidoreductase [Nocardia panacis]|uniref:NADP-dependent oxidoreductase n=1 Tax=Nocardia panacis TaxID=2340916 RepID=A0A3A4K7R6_9NOCA|nr:NADP-dependent oxidoreductase [Nocardia panacis]RJO73572.1 NADP-dependent oxidoreductase [Nocardia panacis]
MTESTRIVLAARPVGAPTPANFRTETYRLPETAEGQVLLRTRYLSLDPYMRGRMSAAKSYAQPVAIGEVMVGQTVSEVLESRAAGYAKGDVVLAQSGWQTHQVTAAAGLRTLDPDIAPVSTALGVLGMPGFTAYSGLLKIGRPKAGETLVVAAATGPVGSVVGQLAKREGLEVVGIAGGPQKVAYLRELGFDAAIDHRAPDFAAQLAAAVPDGIDIYFENVGGAVAQAVYPLLNNFARVPVCGLIAHYNEEGSEGADRLPAFVGRILFRSLTIRGFIQSEFVEELRPRFLREMAGWVADGTVRYREDVVTGLANAPEAFIGLLSGRNFGKLIVRVD